jgi:hypothetical protein
MIRLDHDGDVEMADITGPSLVHAPTKRHTDSRIRKQRGDGDVIQLDHNGDIVMADINIIRPTASINNRYHQMTKPPVTRVWEQIRIR